MRYARLGRTGLRVSELGLGTLPFGGPTDEAEAAAMLDRCLEAGVNHLDCADVYQGGRAEEVLGRLISPRRGDIVLATKVGFPTAAGPNHTGASPVHLRSAVEASLRRLGTDWIDVLYLHRFDHRTSLDHTFRTLDALVRAGDVRHVGVSNFAAWQIAVAQGRCQEQGWAPIDVVQPMYNLVKRQVEVEILPMADELGIAVLPYGPLAGGLLSGKYGAAPGEGAGRLTDDPMYRRRYGADDFEVAQRFAALAAEAGLHPATLAVAWVAAHPWVTAPLIGAKSVAQLEPSLAAAEVTLDDDLIDRVTALVPDPPPPTDRSEERLRRGVPA